MESKRNLYSSHSSTSLHASRPSVNMESKRNSLSSHSSISMQSRRQSLSNKIHNLSAGPTRCCNAVRNACLVACMLLLALSLWMNAKCYMWSAATGFGTVAQYSWGGQPEAPYHQLAADMPGIPKMKELGDTEAWQGMEVVRTGVEGVQVKRLPTLVPIGDMYANVSARPEMNESEVYGWTLKTFKREMTRQSGSKVKNRPAPFRPSSVAQHEALVAQIGNRAHLGAVNTRTRPWCWKLPNFPWPFTLDEVCRGISRVHAQFPLSYRQ